MEQVVQRMHYYKFTVMAALEAIGVPSSKVKFVQESSYQFEKQFIIDQWRLCTLVPQQVVRDAWDRSYNPSMLSPMLCPGLQTLAEEHLDIDFQFGGADQVRCSLSMLAVVEWSDILYSVGFLHSPNGSFRSSGIKDAHT